MASPSESSDRFAPGLGPGVESQEASSLEHFPGDAESQALGVLGLALYAAVALLAAHGLARFRADRSVRDIGFFVLMLLSALMCMPWAVGYIRYKEVPPFWTFVLKSLARIAFFAAFCIVTNRWAKVLYLKHGTQIFHHYILIGLNVILVAIALIDMTLNRHRWSEQMIECESIHFPITVLVQALFTLGVIVVWTALGAQVLARIRAWKSVAHVMIDSNLFGDAMNNLALIMGVTAGCLVLQFVMLVLHFAADTADAKYSTDVYTRCGIIWTALSDFIPHVVPSVVFMLYMEKKHTTVATLQQRYDMNAMLSERESFVSDLLLSSNSGGPSDSYSNNSGSRHNAESIIGYQDLPLEEGEDHLVIGGGSKRARSKGMFQTIMNIGTSSGFFGRAGTGTVSGGGGSSTGSVLGRGGAVPAYEEEGEEGDEDDMPGLRESLS